MIPGIQIFFSPETELSDIFIDFVNQTQQYLYCAFYDIDDDSVINALIDAKNRGVIVKIVAEYDTMWTFDETGNPVSKTEALQKLENAGIPVVLDTPNPGTDLKGANALMHNKFAVSDGKKVWTGSYNLTVNDSKYNNNNVLIIENSQIAKVYENEFNELFGGNFHTGGETTGNSAELEGTDIEVYFNPDDNLTNIVLEKINQARESIYFASFTFTHQEIADALVERHNAGIEVQGVMDEGQARIEGAMFNYLVKNGVDVVLDSNYLDAFAAAGGGKLHHKVIVIDAETVITGSANHTPSAMDGNTGDNDENLIVIRNKTLASVYISEILRLYSRLTSYQTPEKPLKAYFSPNPASPGSEVELVCEVLLPARKGKFLLTDRFGNPVRTWQTFDVTPGENRISVQLKNQNGKNLSFGVYLGVVEIEDVNGKVFRTNCAVAVSPR